MPTQDTADGGNDGVEFRAGMLMDEMMDLANGVEANPEAIAEAGAEIEALKRRVEVLLDAVPPEYARA